MIQPPSGDEIDQMLKHILRDEDVNAMRAPVTVRDIIFEIAEMLEWKCPGLAVSIDSNGSIKYVISVNDKYQARQLLKSIEQIIEEKYYE
jgi:hypothetical protein